MYLNICLMTLRNQDLSPFSSKCLSFFLSFEKVAEVMHYMPLWERINLGLECIGIVVLIGFRYFFLLAFQYSQWLGRSGFAWLFPILVSVRKVL